MALASRASYHGCIVTGLVYNPPGVPVPVNAPSPLDHTVIHLFMQMVAHVLTEARDTQPREHTQGKGACGALGLLLSLGESIRALLYGVRPWSGPPPSGPGSAVGS